MSPVAYTCPDLFLNINIYKYLITYLQVYKYTNCIVLVKTYYKGEFVQNKLLL